MESGTRRCLSIDENAGMDNGELDGVMFDMNICKMALMEMEMGGMGMSCRLGWVR